MKKKIFRVFMFFHLCPSCFIVHLLAAYALYTDVNIKHKPQTHNQRYLWDISLWRVQGRFDIRYKRIDLSDLKPNKRRKKNFFTEFSIESSQLLENTIPSSDNHVLIIEWWRTKSKICHYRKYYSLLNSISMNFVYVFSFIFGTLIGGNLI